MKRSLTAPIVSVIIPAHNAAQFLPAAIESILSQSLTDFELIIVNDGSQDETGRVAREYARQDRRVKVISYRQNQGESAAANIGFLKSKGKYIARMDADDIAHLDRLRKQVAFLDKHTDYIVVGAQAHIIDENDQIIGEKCFPTTNKEIYQEYGNVHPMLHPAIMVRRSMIPWSGKLWANEAEPNDDYYTLFHFLKAGKFANLPQKLMFYRMHSNNKSMQCIKKKFINSLRIRLHAFMKLGYRPTPATYIKLIAQTGFVLTMPEFITLGTFFWMRGIKPFEQAFPQFGQLQKNIGDIFASAPRAEYFVPTMLAVMISSIIRRD